MKLVYQKENSIEESKSESEENLMPISIKLVKSDVSIKNIEELERKVKFSDKVSEFIQKHKQWRKDKMIGRKQSKTLYRNDNLGK